MLKTKYKIEEVIGNVIQLEEHSGWFHKHYKALCPFHTEKTPSFVVHPKTQKFKCFGCGAEGDVYDFVMEYFGILRAEADEKIDKVLEGDQRADKKNNFINQ